MLRLLSETVVTGQANLPARGPLLLIGNHVEPMETAMMALFLPWPVEILGAGDIPQTPLAAALVNLYGHIPINRGHIDRRALTAAVGVLRQGGVIGLFPEGGVWEDGSLQARAGIAWLSQVAQVPVLPVGFGGMRGAVRRMARLEKPHLTMHIGEPLPPVPRGQDRNAVLQAAAAQMMDAVRSLVPQREQWLHTPGVGEQFDFDVSVTRSDGSRQRHYDDFSPLERAALGRLFHRPELLDVLRQRCKLPVEPLQQYDRLRDPAQIAAGAAAVCAYLETTNAQFFHYRLGQRDGAAVTTGLRTLRDIARRAAEAGAEITLTPTRTLSRD